MDGPRTKQEFYRRYNAGEFGNRLRVWLDRETFLASGYDGLIGLRSLDKSASTRYRISAREVRDNWPSDAIVCEQAPDHRSILKGELALVPCGLSLTYATEAVSMKEVKEWRQAVRAEASALLRGAAWPSSYDDIQELLERYPNAAIEFTAYDCAVGCLPYRNVLIWEVREY